VESKKKNEKIVDGSYQERSTEGLKRPEKEEVVVVVMQILFPAFY